MKEGADARTGNNNQDSDAKARAKSDPKGWSASLPPGVRDAMKARDKRSLPRGYEDRLKAYFEELDKAEK